jgi:transaldolase
MAELFELFRRGQSPWLDYLGRSLLVDAGLKRLVNAGLRGVTSNPTIFYKAIAGSDDYDDTIRDLMQADHDISAGDLYRWLTIQDTQAAADTLRGIYESSGGTDGYVSLEVSPHLAYDTEGTVEAARHLWQAVARPNLMIKVPATREGLPAIERLIAGGINVNATLLFSVPRYQAVAEAYLRGLVLNPEPGRVASVASFFVSRIDTKVDKILNEIGSAVAQRLKGRIAVASAKAAYDRFKALSQTEAFATQQARGARVQRPLWASTGTKNPAYSDLLYVESLIGPNTVNTLPPHTLDMFVLRGEVRDTLETDVDAAHQDLAELHALGVDLDQLTQELEQEGVAAFADSYDRLLKALRERLLVVAQEYAAR